MRTETPPGFGRRFWPLWGLGVLGVLALTLQEPPTSLAAQTDIAPWFPGLVIAAVVFAAGHLPALAQVVDLTGPLVAQTIGLNVLAGLVYGWLFWRRSLETAMLAHATTHVGFARWRLT